MRNEMKNEKLEMRNKERESESCCLWVLFLVRVFIERILVGMR